MGKKVTELICIIDRSGSMASIREDAIGGFNTFIEEQKKLDGEARITVALFDDQYELLVDSVDLQDFEGLNEDNFKPRGMTALLDAIGKTITNVTVDGIIPEEKDYIVVILTDGMENMSREYNKTSIMKLIGERTEDDWQFIYLGANQDAIKEAGGLGIKGMYAGNFAASGNGASTAMMNVSAMTTSYRNMGEMSTYMEASIKSENGDN